MSSKSIAAYRALYMATETPRLYTAPWWLDATCGKDQWDALLHPAADGTVTGMAYYQTRIRGLSAVITPPFTQWLSVLGPLRGLDLYAELLKNLPLTSILDLSLLPPEQGIPEGFTKTLQLKYTFVIEGLPNPATYRARYNEGLRRNLKEAEESYQVGSSRDIGLLLQLCVSSYQQRGHQPPGWLHTVVPRVFKALQERSCGEILVAMDQGKAIAGILIAHDGHSMYYLAGGRTADDRGASAHALLLDHAIRKALGEKLVFDFEGSMHPGIANFFQAFGANPQPYWHIRQFRGLGKFWHLFHR